MLPGSEHTPICENINEYTSSVFWWTPAGNEGLRHCANRLETANLDGIARHVGYACKACSPGQMNPTFILAVP